MVLVEQQEPEQGGVGGKSPCGPGVGPASVLVPARLRHFLLQTESSRLIFPFKNYSVFTPSGESVQENVAYQWMYFRWDWYLQSVVQTEAFA